MAYTSETSIEAYLNRDLSTAEQTQLAILIPAVQEWIDKATGSHFDEVAETSQYFDGGLQNLDIHPCTAITEVLAVDREDNEESEFEAEDYVAEPVNKTVKRQLRLRDGVWPAGIANIKITAKFSEYDGGVPAWVQQLATTMCGLMFSLGGDSAGVKRESLEGHSIEYAVEQLGNSPEVQSIIEQHKDLLVE